MPSTIANKQYELSDHLGNVTAVIEDYKTPVNPDNLTLGYTATVTTSTNYYAFGMIMPGRNHNSNEYRFGFNCKEKDDEVKGLGNQYDYGFRIYDPRIAKFLSVDPLFKKFSMFSPYHFASNMPIWAKDIDGAEAIIVNFVDKTINVIGNVYYVSEGRYSVNSTMINTVVEKEIMDKVNNQKDLQELAGFKYNIIVNVIPGGSYENTLNFAKNSSVNYNGTEIKDYRTGIAVINAPDNTALNNNTFTGEQAEDYAFHSWDKKDKIKKIILRDPKSYETKTNTQSEIDKWKYSKLTHELGHFLFTGFHPSNTKNKTGITAEEDENIQLEKRDLEQQQNKEDAYKERIYK